MKYWFGLFSVRKTPRPTKQMHTGINVISRLHGSASVTTMQVNRKVRKGDSIPALPKTSEPMAKLAKVMTSGNPTAVQNYITI